MAETGTVTDIDNNVYRTIKIGDQWWMAEDLRTATFRDGSPLRLIPSSGVIDWASDSLGACTQYDDNSLAPGYLYNWFAVNSAKQIAPAGWHIPTDAEGKALERTLEMSQEQADKTGWRGVHEGEKLKMTGPEIWKTYGEVWATNESGFSAKAGGCRLFDGSWSTPVGFVFSGFWWTKSEFSDEQAWYRYLDYKDARVFRSHTEKNYGFSIRCVKD
ncbi:MAG: fibrobacter succinogenes major paralogous domain-containing protein [Bacteroidetes bacterium]|nr:fibrobacter succinogenes major paralogous domain-containing protein [Bacteroidota bacterium]